jgi:predicted ATPase
VDAERFRRLVGEARRLAADGAQERAAARFREGLALWRGPPLADLVFESFAGNELEQLDEERLEALGERIDCELALGRHEQLIGELETLVRQHPLRERLRGQLMLALYRSGRQAEALAAYQDARRALVELGLDPGAELQALEQAILGHDPALALSPRPAASKLPAPPTRLIGREQELAEAGALLRAQRLVTLTGAGGSGKTRLALELAARLERNSGVAAYFVDLAPLAEPELVVSAVARTLELEPKGDRPLLDTLTAQLRERRLLLVLDNCEHLLAAGPDIAALLAAVPGLRVLATSRSPLHLRGEWRYELGPLPLADAVALFVERARAAQHGFEPDPAVERICRRLDGLPLAIELAAARVNTLAPAEIVERLSGRLDLLSEGARDAPARQRTLRATIDWSYDLLDPAEQQLFARLSVFAGGCTREAAEQVCGAEPEVLASLVDMSLLRRRGSRYRMLETIRTIASARLDALPDADESRRAHATYFYDFADRQRRRHFRASPEERGRLWDETRAELDNLRRAFDWAMQRGERDLALRLIARGPLVTAGTIPDGRRLLASALALPGTSSPRAEAEAFGRAGLLAFYSGDYKSSCAFYEESLRRYRTLGDEANVAFMLGRLGQAESSRGAVERARALLREAAELSRRAADPVILGGALHALGELECNEGRYAHAAELLEEAISVLEEAGSTQVWSARSGLADVRLEQGDVETAEHLYRGVLVASRLAQDKVLMLFGFGGLAATAAARAEAPRAGRLWGGVERLEDEQGTPIRSSERARYMRFLDRLDREAFSREREIGRALPLDEVLHYALADLPQLSGVPAPASHPRHSMR